MSLPDYWKIDSDMAWTTMEYCPCTLHASFFLQQYENYQSYIPRRLDCQVQWYSIAITWCCCKRSTIEFYIYSNAGFKKCRKCEWNNIIWTKYVAYCTESKNVPECIIYYLGNLIQYEAHEETDKNGMMALHLACWNKMETLLHMYLKNIRMQQHYKTDWNLPFHLTCIWHEHLPATIMHKLLDTFRNALWSKTKHDKSLQLHYFLQSSPLGDDDLYSY